ncbi:MAG: PilN domain-containing protein [Gemmatimonadetes bacterium]|nr:PilN domain-containing protein [Gemmatimonadota bacterium]NIR80897.1 PilN domain-containing protein [Gemmatimonadota bacterium]NIT88559.1 PilN domain-containing protein [Gemmatimonadota bacterium]NIU33500.1 PilN domain-containing protein [Gemmatimonadota bacterium]NIV63831.1 hypothetical protein [Gemmatimonadota bacterium]
MIEVNLLPGSKKRAAGQRKWKFELPEFGGLPTDRWILGSAVITAAVIVAVAYMYLSMSARISDVGAQVDEAVQDSARYADLIEQAEQLRARRDSIATRVAIIQEIDRDRYVWPHVLDEVARALPEYTWLESVVQTASGQELGFRIEGSAGTNFALTRFMQNLEASPFVRSVTLINTQLNVVQSGNVGRNVNRFTLEARYEQPPFDALETVPLFGSETPALTSSP